MGHTKGGRQGNINSKERVPWGGGKVEKGHRLWSDKRGGTTVGQGRVGGRFNVLKMANAEGKEFCGGTQMYTVYLAQPGPLSATPGGSDEAKKADGRTNVEIKNC